MSYQTVRGALEAATATALSGAGVTRIHFDNVAHNQPDADQVYAEISVSFSDVKQDVVGCCGVNDIGGTISVFIFTPANSGSAAGEEIALQVADTWAHLQEPRLRNFDGPRTIANAEGAVHQLFSLSAAFRGKLN
jgi:hypothetical protein